MDARSRREKNRQEVRKMILGAAREALLRDGHKALSMRDLARKIDYSPGTIYLHFKDKQDLLHCVVEESFAKLHEALRAVPSRTTGVQMLKKRLRVYVDFGLHFPHHYHFAFMMEPAGDGKSSGSIPHPAFDVLRNSVRDCVERKQLRRVDVETTSQSLWAVVHGITSLMITKPDFPWTGKDKVIDHAIEIAVDGLRSQKHRAR